MSEPKLGANEGLVVLVVETNRPLESVLFVDEEGLLDFQVPYANRGTSIHLFRMPAGKYYLTSYRAPSAIYSAPGSRPAKTLSRGRGRSALRSRSAGAQ